MYESDPFLMLLRDASCDPKVTSALEELEQIAAAWVERQRRRTEPATTVEA